jgi:hypothetical protein
MASFASASAAAKSASDGSSGTTGSSVCIFTLARDGASFGALEGLLLATFFTLKSGIKSSF